MGFERRREPLCALPAPRARERVTVDFRPCALVLLALFIGAGPALFAQEPDPAAPAAPKPPLSALHELIELARKEVEAKRSEVDAARSDAEKTKLNTELGAAEGRLADMEDDFQAIATGVDVEGFGLRERERLDLAQTFQQALRPLAEEFKQVTEQLRAAEELRSNIEYQTRRREIATTALENIDEAIAATSDPEVVAELKTLRARWQDHAQNASNQLIAFNYQLQERISQKKPILDTVTDGFKAFFRSRGRNVLLTLVTFLLVYLLLRWLGRYLHRFSPWHKPGKRSFYSRLVDVIYHSFTFVGALLAALLVLYASGDWVLLGLAVIVMVALVLAAKGGLPRFYDHARSLLNLGEVREGERVMIDGIPWKVLSLGVFTDLANPMLDGGSLRLPIRNLTNLLSRPYDDKEPWFPCRTNEWVSLSDGTRGKVIQQTPETVHMVLLGGSRKAYPTTDFLAAAPEVLSRGYRVRSVFGIDYRHQAIATTEIPETLLKAIKRDLLNIVEPEQVGRIKVEFREAGSSSLDYEIIADMKGEVADKFEVIARALQKAAVDSCNENGWTIPFPQLTLHRAESSTAVDDGASGDAGS